MKPRRSASPRAARRGLVIVAVTLITLIVTALAASLLPLPGRPAPVIPPLPARLADTGLYADFATRKIAGDLLAYSPQYPLWSDGAHKRRWIRLPPGTAIDASDPDHWRFPVGTRLWKEFALERVVETRYLEQVAEGHWRYATYHWNEDGSDAVLAPEQGIAAAARLPGGEPYDLPARSSCLACHEGGRTPVLGFGALQLSADRDPLAPHAEPSTPDQVDVTELDRRGLLRGLPKRLIEAPPRVPASSPRERAALGYLHGNCAACHGRGGALAMLGFSLDTRLGDGGEGEDPRTRLQSPKRTARLLERIGCRVPNQQMPPLGTRVIDADAVALISAWVREDLRRQP